MISYDMYCDVHHLSKLFFLYISQYYFIAHLFIILIILRST